jgi:hypothetical protein
MDERTLKFVGERSGGRGLGLVIIDCDSPTMSCGVVVVVVVIVGGGFLASVSSIF